MPQPKPATPPRPRAPAEPAWRVLSVTLAGLHAATTEPRHSVSISTFRLDPHLHHLAEGGYVIDKREPLDADWNLALRQPYLDVSLPAGEVRGPDTPEGILRQGLTAIYGSDGAGEILNAPHGYSGTDSVAVDVYVEYWRRAGARIGVRRGDQVQWEDGEVQKILPDPSA